MNKLLQKERLDNRSLEKFFSNDAMVVVGNNHKIKIHIWRRITFDANNSHVLGCPLSRGVGA